MGNYISTGIHGCIYMFLEVVNINGNKASGLAVLCLCVCVCVFVQGEGLSAPIGVCV